MLGSVLWFSALGFGARYLSPVLRGKRAWRVLDGLIAVLMFVVAGTLVFA
jgi:L-lysine exporter family protein LysE/ArgO